MEIVKGHGNFICSLCPMKSAWLSQSATTHREPAKWNKIEHRLFSFISLNWRGKPLLNFETIVNLIGGTRTRSGLKVQAILDTNPYPTGVEISDDEIDKLRIKRHAKLPAWNYTLSPRIPSR